MYVLTNATSKKCNDGQQKRKTLRESWTYVIQSKPPPDSKLGTTVKLTVKSTLRELHTLILRSLLIICNSQQHLHIYLVLHTINVVLHIINVVLHAINVVLHTINLFY